MKVIKGLNKTLLIELEMNFLQHTGCLNGLPKITFGYWA